MNNHLPKDYHRRPNPASVLVGYEARFTPREGGLQPTRVLKLHILTAVEIENSRGTTGWCHRSGVSSAKVALLLVAR
jgi:hypothetical protein